MPDKLPHALLTGGLLCLFALCGCEQPQSPGPTNEPQILHEPPTAHDEPATTVEPPTAPPPPAAPSTPATTMMKAPAGKPPDLESLVLSPEERPFAETATHSFGKVNDADWLVTPQRRSTGNRLLPDLFTDAGHQDRVDIEGELLLDDTEGISDMVDGLGMKLKFNTD